MWYNSQPMSRRGLSFTLLALLALQLLSGVAEASLCVEPCPEEDEGSAGCSPVCTLCASCTNAKSAIVRHAASGTLLGTAERYFPDPPSAPASQLTSDIFHVPLAA